jgi:aminoglycoside 3-N-acetyltransferase
LTFLDDILSVSDLLFFHSSFKCLSEFCGYQSPELFTSELNIRRAENQTIVMPSFTYNFVNRLKQIERFEKSFTKSLTGAVTETFRRQQGVIRTSSPSHSFLILGDKLNIFESNNPISPLGKGSVCEAFHNSKNGRIILVGCGFESLTHLHYFENKARLPYINTNPWKYMGAEPLSVSTEGVYPVIEFPGCAKGFTRFEKYLVDRGELKSLSESSKCYIINPSWLWEKFLDYISTDKFKLLCVSGCKTCETRLIQNNSSINRTTDHQAKILFEAK